MEKILASCEAHKKNADHHLGVVIADRNILLSAVIPHCCVGALLHSQVPMPSGVRNNFALRNSDSKLEPELDKHLSSQMAWLHLRMNHTFKTNRLSRARTIYLVTSNDRKFALGISGFQKKTRRRNRSEPA